MSGFILVAYNNNNLISINELEKDLYERNINFVKKETSNNDYQSVIGYQFTKNKNNPDDIISNHLISGDVYGLFQDNDNFKILEYNNIINLLNSSLNDRTEYYPLEGNICFTSIYKDKIIIQNDIAGCRKLYYYIDENIFCVSTFLPLIFKAVINEWSIRRNAVLGFLCGRESKWPLSFIDKINVLTPLTKGTICKNKITTSTLLYSKLYDLNKIDKNNLREKLLMQYEISISRKTSTNTAITLSGGYDSNCIYKLYNKLYSKDITAISVGYEANRMRDNNIYNETIYAEKIANKYKTPFKKYILSKCDFFNELDSLIDNIDQPAHDPSSNFIMNKYLKKDGFELVVNGMGGDALFSSKKNLTIAMMLSDISKKTGFNSISNLGKLFKYRGPFSYYKSYFKNNNKSNTFFDIYERNQLFRSDTSRFINETILESIDCERIYRYDYFEKIFSNAKTKLEIYHSLALLLSPGENHAITMAERNGIEILMPFVDTKAILMMFNGSHFNNVTNRKFETSIFSGIDVDLLAKRKSGFSIPYSEWLKSYSQEIFDYYRYFFNKIEFDLELFEYKYKTDLHFQNSDYANKLIWKLLITKLYINRYNLK